MTNRARSFAVLALVVLLGTMLFPDVASADLKDDDDLRLSRFSPTFIHVQAQNDAAWGDIAYWVGWDGEELLSARDINSGDTDEAGIEIGVKATGNDKCGGDPQNLGRVGWPAVTKVRVDTSESPDDAVLQLTELAALRNDQKANPGKTYLAFWRCGNAVNSNNFNDVNRSEYLQVQLVSQRWFVVLQEVWEYGVDATSNSIPGGRVLLPGKASALPVDSYAYLSWTGDWDMRSGKALWKESGSVITDIGDDLRVNPAGDSGWIWQDPRVAGNAAGVQLKLGNNSFPYVDSKLRCNQNNTGNCRVTFYVKSDTSCCWRTHAFTIPNDGGWKTVAAQDFGTLANDQILNLWVLVETAGGGTMDFDWLWMQWGI